MNSPIDLSEKQFNSKSTYDAFDEIYTNFDLSVEDKYTAKDGYPFDYPIRWLNDPSMNKRIAIRRLDAIPSTHSFSLTFKVAYDEGEDLKDGDYGKIKEDGYWYKKALVDITEYDNLIKVLNYLCNQFKYYTVNDKTGGLNYVYGNDDNILKLVFLDSNNDPYPFEIIDDNDNDSVRDFLAFLNQDITDETVNYCNNSSLVKEFHDVWNRDRLHFHASFSTSRRKFIGKRGDFYQNLSLLYPPPSNESTFYIHFTSNGVKKILLLYCEFDVQLCFIVNYMKSRIL